MRPARTEELYALQHEQHGHPTASDADTQLSPTQAVLRSERTAVSMRAANLAFGCIWAAATAGGFCIATSYIRQSLLVDQLLVVAESLLCSMTAAACVIAYSARLGRSSIGTNASRPEPSTTILQVQEKT